MQSHGILVIDFLVSFKLKNKKRKTITMYVIMRIIK